MTHGETARDGMRLVIYRRAGAFIEVLHFDADGTVTISRDKSTVQVDLSRCPVIPSSALAALRAAIETAPTKAEHAPLKEALTAELAHIDQALAERADR